jgi:hypothetical protein
MKFTPRKKWQHYRSWVYHDILHHIEYYIYEIPKDGKSVYHFTIHSDSIKYSSLVDYLFYTTLDECISAVQTFRESNNLIGKQLDSNDLYK